MEEASVPDILNHAEGEGETLEFSLAQIEYLRSEFERQRRWVGTLSAREKSAWMNWMRFQIQSAIALADS